LVVVAITRGTLVTLTLALVLLTLAEKEELAGG